MTRPPPRSPLFPSTPLSRSLASAPRALLLDEPFSALDPALRVELGRELSSVLAEQPIPTLLVTHDREDAQRLAERVVRSEEHTSELQSPCNLVCRLLLEKKK